MSVTSVIDFRPTADERDDLRRMHATTFDEPSFAPWRDVPFADVVERLAERARARREGPLLAIAVDGRSGAGKSTFAARLADALPQSAVVGTDDAAWHHSFFDWEAELLAHVLEPASAGRAVRWRPPAWRERGRDGAIEVPAGTRWLVLEGAGAARRELSSRLDASVWIASDPTVARARELARDGEDADTLSFIEEWGAAERAFMEGQRPWERADLVVNGTPDAPVAGDRLAVATWSSSNEGGTR